ncbi:MAG: glutathione S-transferase family protein [Granulosicoccus sp.]
MITVWGRASSSNVQCVMWCIAELGLPVERIDAGLMYGVNDTAEYLAMNPNGAVPTLKDGDGPALWESGAIVRYLANTYANDDFWPRDSIRRADVDRWAEWSKISVQMNFNAPIFWPMVRLSPQERNVGELHNAITHFENMLRIAQHQLEKHEFLTGSKLTLADIQFGHILYRYFELDIPRANLPQIKHYYQTLTAMPNYREHVMINFDELRFKQ